MLSNMLELPIGRLIHAYQRLASTAQFLKNWHPDFGPPSHENKAYKDVMPTFRDEDYIELRELADEFCSLCLAVSLTVTHGAAKQVCLDIRRAKQDPKDNLWSLDKAARIRLNGSLDGLIACMRNEAETKAAMVLPPEKLSLFSPIDPIFGTEVRAKFPSAIYDIDEAAKCLALGRHTACVFHLMRAMEVVLKAVSACLGLAAPRNPNWGTWLDPIKTEIQRRSPVGSRKWAKNDFFQDVYMRIDAIKDAQRNQTMHVESIYTEDEASLIFKNTQAFMQKIASQMDESGLPVA